ncbi:MAG: ribose 1,5-bisphosphate isomerase, partial [Candidatus Omnitrophica bacterium]|nr:ribose 1,5-bisphosphate isomerase [Candidatus Omnitrophota bacterium]
TRFVVDATGHTAEVTKLAGKKSRIRLRTKTGGLMGEKSMCAQIGEESIVKNSKEVAPGLYVCGMCANAVFGGPRMGPIFGGMLLSGRKVAQQLLKRL